MSEFNRKKNNKFWHSPLVLLVLFFILIIFSYNILSLFNKERETSVKKDILLSQIEVLRNREVDISSNIKKLNTDEGIEETIREKFQVAKEGEKVVIIVDRENIESTVSTEEKSGSGFIFWIKNIFK